jgi:hypothetical protein
VRVPILFNWQNEERKQAGGFTRDVSSAGVYVLCDTGDTPPPGVRVEIQIMLPPIDVKAHGLKLKSAGFVVRVNENESTYEETGYALKVDFE